MRTYVYIQLPGATAPAWQVWETDATGNNGLVYLGALFDVLALPRGASPIFGAAGVGSQQAVMTQVWPDYDVNVIQQQYAQYFESLAIIRVSGATEPTYNVFVTFFGGIQVTFQIVGSTTRLLGTEAGQVILTQSGQGLLIT